MTERRFLYFDLDAYFACCEILRDRSLLTIPFAVGGSPNQRGVVSSASYPARRRGVKSAMSMRVALRLCPELRVITPHFEDYRQRSQEVMDYLRTMIDACEQRSIVMGSTDTGCSQRSSRHSRKPKVTLRTL